MASEPPTTQSRQASPLLEFLPTPRQLSPLPAETAARKVASEEERFERVRRWNENVRHEEAQPFPWGSIYIPQGSDDQIRRSARVAHKSPTLQTPAGIYYHSSYTPTCEQKAQIVINCEEVNGTYCISQQDWVRERRQHRILARDFPHYYGELDIYGTVGKGDSCRRATVQILNLLSEPVWKALDYQQAEYRPPESRESTPPTSGFSTDESIPSECSDTDLFGCEVRSPPRTPSPTPTSTLNHGKRLPKGTGPAEDRQA